MDWDSESVEAGPSSACIIYLGNGILCICRQPLKYLCFSYSFLNEIRKYVDSIPPRKICWKWLRQSIDSTALNKVWSVSVREREAAKILRVNCDCCEEKSC